MTVAELKKQAKEAKIKNWWLMTKAELEACLNVNAAESRVMEPEVVTPVNIHTKSNQIISEALARGDLQVPGLLVNNRVPEVSPQGEHESVEDYIARGGKITVIPTPLFPAPKPTRESSAMKADPATTKRTPRKVAKPVVEAKPERKRPTTTKPNKGTQVEDKPTKGYGTRKQDIIAKAQHGLKLLGKGPKANPDVVTLASLTEGRDIEGRILRRMLRNSDITKPGAQWEWPKGHADIAKVEALINKRWI